MGRPARRWMVLMVATALAAGATAWVVLLERDTQVLRERASTTTTDIAAAGTAVGDARRAIAAMASPGQPAVSWSRQAEQSIALARRHVTAVASAAGAGALAGSLGVLDKLAEAQSRVRDHAAGGRTLLASDVAFGEALPLLDTLSASATQALASVSGGLQEATDDLRRRQALAAGGALGALLLAGLVLVRPPRAEPSDARDDAVTIPAEPNPFAAAPVATPVAPTALDFDRLAAICADLAKVDDAEGLASVVARSSGAMGARGVVLWRAETDRRVLTAVASSGYDARLVERFGSIGFDEDNPTAQALRSGREVISRSATGETTALAVPLMGAHGSGGVLAAELAPHVPATDAASAVRLVAAQLSTLLLAPAPPEDVDIPDRAAR